MTLPESFCIIPWVSLETTAMGQVKVCCIATEEIVKEDGSGFDLTKDTLSQAFNTKFVQDLRKQLLNGEKPKHCNQCWEQERAGMTSKRQYSTLKMKNECSDIDWTDLEPKKIKFLDLKLGNICNLKCRICGSWSSSRWADEEIKYTPGIDKTQLHAYQLLKKGSWPRTSDSNFWQNLREILPDIEFMEFTGGEPFMIKEHFDLLKYAVEQGYSKNIDIHYNTNGTVDPNEDSWVWQHFKSVQIAFSIDNVGDRFEYERYGANWLEVNDNISWISTYKQHDGVNLTTQLCFTINIQNVYYLDELLQWAETKNFDSIHFNLLMNPDHLSIQNMTPEANELVLNKLKTTFWTTEQYQREINGVINFIENGSGSDGLLFRRRMKQTDEFRNQNFMDTHPEIALAMRYDR